MGKAAIATTSAMTSTFVKGVTTAAIKGEEIDLNSISEQTINAGKSGIVLNAISQGLVVVNPNLPESVNTIIENVVPAIYEIRNSWKLHMKKFLIQMDAFFSTIIAEVIYTLLRKHKIVDDISFDWFLLIVVIIFILYMLAVGKFVKK